jgi:hypothetical protein
MMHGKRSVRLGVLGLLTSCFIAMTNAAGFCESQLMVAVKKGLETDYAPQQVEGNFYGFSYGINDLGADTAGCWSAEGFFNFTSASDPMWSASFTGIYNDIGGSAPFQSDFNGFYDMLLNGTVEMSVTGSSQLMLGLLSEDKNYLLLQYDNATRQSDDNRLRLTIATREGSGTYNNSTLAGSYALRLMLLYDFHNPDKEAAVGWGTISFDGQSTYQLEYWNEGGYGESNDGTSSGLYTVNSDGSVIVYDEQGQSIMEGHLSTDGNVFILANALEGNPSILFFGFKGTDDDNPYDTTDLLGQYSHAGLWVDGLATGNIADQIGNYNYGTITFDGQGGFTAADNVFNSSGSTETNTFEGTYSITTQGEVQLITTTKNGRTKQTFDYFTGHLSNDRQLLVFNLIYKENVNASNEGTDTGMDTETPSDGEGKNDEENSDGCFINTVN